MALLYKQGIHNFTTAAVNQTLGRSCICSRDRQQTQKQKEALHTTKEEEAHISGEVDFLIHAIGHIRRFSGPEI